MRKRTLGCRMSPMRKLVGSKGFSMVEMLTSIIIIGVLISVFYSVFILNWKALEDYSVRSGLWQDMDAIIDQVTLDAREAAQINVAPNQKNVSLLNQKGGVIASYTLAADKTCQVTRAGATTKLTHYLDYNLSTFRKNGESLIVNVVLKDDIFGRGISIDAATEIYPRN